MSSTMPTAQKPQQQSTTPPALSLPIITYIRDLFKGRENLNEFDLCYYETRKVALCAHLLKPK